MKQAAAFLQNKPTSAHRPFISFAAAQAAETSWSLSIAPIYDPCVDAFYREGAGAKRDRAMQAYIEVIQLTDATDPRHRFARRQLRRLEAGFDTGARYFFDCYA